MLKVKKFLVLIVMSLAIILIANKADAAVEYTRDFPANDGTIELNLTGLELDESKQYEFSLVSKGGTPEAWNLITSYTTTTAKLTLSPATDSIVEVLRVADDGQIFIREKDNTESYLVDRMNVNLKLPYLKAVVYEHSNLNSYIIDAIYGKIGDNYINGGKTFYKFEKVTDEVLIEEFLKDKTNTDRLEEFLPTPPDRGYTEDKVIGAHDYDDGLYILWIRLSGENCKTIQAAIIHDGLPNATTPTEYGVIETPVTPGNPETPDEPEVPTTKTLASIEITNSPKKTVYKVGEKFDTTGMIVTAKYQDGTLKVVTNYTYSPSGALKETNQTITISYTENGVTKQAKQPIKVAVNGDTTQAPTKIPDAGVGFGVIVSLVVVSVIGVYAYRRNKNLEGI